MDGPKGGTMIPGVPDLITYIGLGWFASEQLGKKSPQNTPQAAAPPQAQAQPQTGAGAFVGAQRRAPLGPVALDWDIDEETERNVWACIRDRNLAKATRFAQALTEVGLPVAAAAVSMHVLKLREAQAAAQAASAVEVMHEHVPAPAPAQVPAPAPRVVAPRAPRPARPAAPAGHLNGAPAGAVISAVQDEEPADAVTR
jgi:hypothetical protein